MGPVLPGLQVPEEGASGAWARVTDAQIINSLEKGRLSDAALFATRVRPSGTSEDQPIIDSPASELQIHKAAFFFRLERELEKINAFYLQKESDLRSRLTTLISKKRVLIAMATHRVAGAKAMRITRNTPSLVALLEGFRYFEKDLAKLQVRVVPVYALTQQFIEINATGFRKILKKWDKRSKSQTKELYLARQVEVQRAYPSLEPTDPACFNREFIAEMSDIAAASVLQLESIADGHVLPASMFKSDAQLLRGSMPLSASNLPGGLLLQDNGNVGDLVFDSERPLDFEAERISDSKNRLAELEERLSNAVHDGRINDAQELLAQARKETDMELDSALGSEARAAENDPQAPVHSGLSHQMWRALMTAPPAAVRAAIDADIPDFAFVDDINARTALHLATLSGNLELVRACVEHGIDVQQCDVYGRQALAYAAMHGATDICHYLLSLPALRHAEDCVVDAVDLDGFSPLVHAIVRGHTDVVRALLEFSASIGAPLRGKSDLSDLSPLAIAAQRGHVEITRLLLERGAKIEPNTEGLLPQTLAARAGHTECLRLLIDAHVDVNAVEKGTLCTPLFYAAEYGHADCVRLLLASGASIEHVDEKQRHAVFYAAWYGWAECVHLLLAAHRDAAAAASLKEPPAPPPLQAPAGAPSSAPPMDDLDEGDGIPSLYLPPPIIPFRTYGHNYLDKRSLLCLSLSNKSIVLHKASVSDRPDMFPGLTSSLKLVLTPRSGDGESQAGIPHTIILPMADDREEVTFQIADVDQFYLEFEIFPTFGSARLAKTVMLPDGLNRASDRTPLQLPLLDWHLNVVGHISAVVECVRPFGSVQLQIGGRVETYWKSTLPSSNQPLTTSPPTHPASGGADSNAGAHDTSAYVTASSLSGNYLRVIVRFTCDLVPVVSAAPRLGAGAWAPTVDQVTAEQFAAIAQSMGVALTLSPDEAAALSFDDWAHRLETTLVSLETLLATLPQDMAVALEVSFNESLVQPSHYMPVNSCIDAALHAVYDAAERDKNSRRLFFSSAMPSACVALNWKQPNYAVFFINQSTLDRQASPNESASHADSRQSSLAEAVRFAKGNNLLGVMVDAPMLTAVPELISAVKAAGLVLITLSKPLPPSEWPSLPPTGPAGLLGTPTIRVDDAFDGFVENNVVQCTK